MLTNTVPRSVTHAGMVFLTCALLGVHIYEGFFHTVVSPLLMNLYSTPSWRHPKPIGIWAANHNRVHQTPMSCILYISSCLRSQTKSLLSLAFSSYSSQLDVYRKSTSRVCCTWSKGVFSGSLHVLFFLTWSVDDIVSCLSSQELGAMCCILLSLLYLCTSSVR